MQNAATPLLKPNPFEIRSLPVTTGRRRAKVLIIDDDIDSALQIESIFSHLGCETAYSLHWTEAKKKICSLHADVIVLDWMLDTSVDAGDIVALCSKTFSRLGWHQNRGSKRPKIITFSSLKGSEIRHLNSPFFDHYDHWEKPMTQRELLGRALRLLNGIHK